MGQKANPKSLRLGITDEWDSIWFDEKNYSQKIMEDFTIRNFISKEFERASVSNITVKRKSDQLEVVVTVARPGIISSGTAIDIPIVLAALKQLLNLKNVIITIKENKRPDLSASLISSWISSQIEKRVPFRRVMKMAIQKCLKAGANGVKISCSGRLAGIEIARREWYKEGGIPLHTLRAIIDYSFNEANTTYGKIGVKVWIYKGQNISKKGEEINNVVPKKNKA